MFIRHGRLSVHRVNVGVVLGRESTELNPLSNLQSGHFELGFVQEGEN